MIECWLRSESKKRGFHETDEEDIESKGKL